MGKQQTLPRAEASEKGMSSETVNQPDAYRSSRSASEKVEKNSIG